MKYILILFFTSILFSQQQVGRSVSPNSLLEEYDSTSTLFPVNAFWAEMQKGFLSEGDAMNSNIRFGGLMSFFRWKNTSLDFNLAFELTADPYNEILFNPRSARWQEELFLIDKNFLGTFKYGFMHRCKHEIDNYDPDDAADADPTYRIMLSSGPFVSWIKNYKTKNWNNSFEFRADNILLKGDYRDPENELLPNWNDLFGELSATTLNELRVTKVSEIYLRNWFNSMLFTNSIEFNIRSELGIKFKQKANSMKIYVAYEHLYDDFMMNFPRESNVIYIGFRGSDLIFW